MTVPKVTIIFMGDSITEGQYVDPKYRWSALISDDIEKEYLSTPVNFLMLNKGISGETTRQGLLRFPADVQNHYPDIMTLQFGLNDCNCWVTNNGMPRVSKASYKANMLEMIARAKSFGVKHIIVSTNHNTLKNKIMLCGKSFEGQRLAYNEIVRDVAKETNVTFCDMAKAFNDFGEDKLANHLLPYPDLLHLSKLGHEHYASTIKPYIDAACTDIINQQRKGE